MFKSLILDTLDSLKNISEEYYVEENAIKFVKKLSAATVIFAILCNNGENIEVQISSFIQEIAGDHLIDVTGSAFCQRRQQIKYEIFVDTIVTYQTY